MSDNDSQEIFMAEENYQSPQLSEFQRSFEKIKGIENNISEPFFDEEKINWKKCKNILGFSINNDKSNNDKNDDDLIYYIKTTTITPKKKIFQSKKVKKVFLIRKKEKNERTKGRLPLGHRPLNIPKHNKNSVDNIATKIKAHFVKKTLKYINKKFNEFLLQKKQKKETLLMNIKPNSYNIFSKKANQNFLKLKIHELFSADLTNRIRRFPKDYNRTQIKSLLKKKEATEVINIMNSTVKEMYEFYSSNEITDYNLESDLNEISQKNGKEENNDEKEEELDSNDIEEIEEEEEVEEGIDGGSENDKEKEKEEEDEKEYKDKYKNIAEKLVDLLDGKIKRKNL